MKTSAYDQALECLKKNNVLIIIGAPGVGKTITSQMLVLYYTAQGYRVRYTTDGADLAELKKALSQSKETKEVILLDDCFGQAYFSMKETQENELLSLIRYVKMNPNKVLIMNSRVTIYREAQERTPALVSSLDRKEYKAYVIDMSRISDVEKARIFYHHLYFGNVPLEYRTEIRKNKHYLQIVRHKNYNPRIVEFICSRRQIESVKADQYFDFVMRCLDKPEQIWKNEYEKRLAASDRILLMTLYSLTNTMISIEHEMEFSIDVGMLVSQIEIYDQVWYVRHMPPKGEHSLEAMDLVRAFVAKLEEIPDACAEWFPFDLIDQLREEYLSAE